MKETPYLAHKFMLEYQEKQSRPPTLEEVARGIGLARRSSAAHVVRTLVLMGLARAIGQAGEARRYIAIRENDSNERERNTA